MVHLDGDAFAVAVERRRGRAPRGVPVLVGSNTEGRGTVVCASYEARTQGVVNGVPLGWARWRIPAAVLIPRDVIACEEAARAVLEFLRGEAPVVEMAGPDDFFLDMTGCERWCGGDVGLWTLRLLERLKKATELEFSAGVATRKSLARVATRLAKPAGMTYVPAGAEKDFLQPLALEMVLGTQTEWGDGGQSRFADLLPTLQEFGCRHVGDVLALGRERLGMLFGAEGELLWGVLQGEESESVRPTFVARTVETEHVFEPDTCEPAMVTAGLRLAVERLGWELRQRGQRCGQVLLTAVYCDGAIVRRWGRLGYPTNQTHELWAVAKPWTVLLMRRRVRLRRLHLRAPTEGGGIEISDFFEEQRLARTTRLYEALDRVRGRYGWMSIVSAAAVPAVREVRRDSMSSPLSAGDGTRSQGGASSSSRKKIATKKGRK